jgi:hypothetical protein
MSRGLSPAKNLKDWHRRTKDRWQKKVWLRIQGKKISSSMTYEEYKQLMFCNWFIYLILQFHSWKNCQKPVGLLICQISQVPNKFHKPLASDLWLNSPFRIGKFRFAFYRYPQIWKVSHLFISYQNSLKNWYVLI